MTIFDKEARAGFPRMRGARVRAAIPISEDLLQRMLSKVAVGLELHNNNVIFVSWRAFRVQARLVEITPDLTVVLSASWLSRTAIRAALTWKPGLQKWLAQQDGLVYILCSRFPAVARHEYLWRHISAVQARTAPGKLTLNVDVDVR